MQNKYRLNIDVGSSKAKCSLLQKAKDGQAILKLIDIDVTNLAKEEFIRKIKSTISSSFSKGELSGSDVVLGLNYPLVEIKRLEFPAMPKDEIREAIVWHAKDKISLDIQESFFDYVIAGEYEDEQATRKIIVLVAIALKETINQLSAMCKDLELEIVGIKALPFSLGKIPKLYENSEKDDCISIIDIGCCHTSILLYRKFNLSFLRIIPIASNNVTKALSGTFTTEKSGKVELTDEKSEELKRKYGIPLDINEEFLENTIPTKQILARMRPILESLVTEIKRSYDYYSSELDGTSPSKVYLTGGGSLTKNIGVFLKDELSKDVVALDLPKSIHNKTDVNEHKFAPSISLSIESDINEPGLLPVAFQKQKLQRVEKISIRMVSFIIFVVLGVFYLVFHLKQVEYMSRSKTAMTHQKSLSSVLSLYSEMSAKKELEANLLSGSVNYEGVFKTISSLIPGNIMLEQLSLSEGKKILSFKGNYFGSREDAENVITSFIQNLDESELFVEATIVRIRKSGDENRGVTVFEVTCTVK